MSRVVRIAALCLALLAVCGGGCTWKASSGSGNSHRCKDLDNDGFCDDDGGTIIVVETVVAGDGPGDDSDDVVGDGVSADADAQPFAPSDPWDLSGAVVTPGAQGWHAVARLDHVSHVGLAALLGPGVHGPAALRDVTAGLRERNAALLALPAADGELVFEDAQWIGDALAVTWRQQGGIASALAHLDLRQTFWFDALGALLIVENRLLVADAG